MRYTVAVLPCVVLFFCGVSAFSQPQGGQRITKAKAAERVRTFDADNDGNIAREEFKGPAAVFKQIDKNEDAVISSEELTEFAKEGDQMITIGPTGPSAGGQKQGTPTGGIPADVRPLSEMSATDRYKGEDGGLYGKGRNAPPKEHFDAALKEAKQIQPLDKDGKPSKDGKVALISFGMSNTTQEFQKFLQMIQSLKLSPSLVVVDGAQGGKEATAWATEAEDKRTERTPWEELANRLQAKDVSPLQVQVVWMKLAVAGPAKDGEFPVHAKKFQELVVACLQKLKSRYPHVRLVYVSNRIYAGYATTPLNPEPYAYEYSYGLRWVILDQINGKPELNYDPKKGEVKAPLVLWGPDLWANGETARKDGFSWSKSELGPDGTHPSDAGREKVAKMLISFFQSDPTARGWFLGE